jgi:hypothetical protein
MTIARFITWTESNRYHQSSFILTKKCFCLPPLLAFKNEHDHPHPFSHKYWMSGWFVPKIKNLYIRPDFANERFGDFVRIHYLWMQFYQFQEECLAITWCWNFFSELQTASLSCYFFKLTNSCPVLGFDVLKFCINLQSNPSPYHIVWLVVKYNVTRTKRQW